MATIKVVKAIPTEGHTPAESFQNIRLREFHLGRLEMIQSAGHRLLESGKSAHEVKDILPEFKPEWPRFEFYDLTAGRLFTPMAREKLAHAALQLGADYIFMFDDDMLGQQDLFERLWRHQVDVVAGLAFTRNPPYNPVLYQIKEGWDPIHKREYCTTNSIRAYPKDKLVECDAVGFGSVLIRTSVFKKMDPPYFMTSSGTGEDILFCIKAKKAGARIFMDTSTKLGHIGAPIIVDEERSVMVNDPVEMEKLYGAYKRQRVFDVCHWPDTGFDGLDKANKEPVLMAGII